MSEKRVLTEHEWKLIAGVFNGDIVVEDGELLWIGHGLFDPLYSHADLARFVEAMQAARYVVSRWAWAHDELEHETIVHYQGEIISKRRALTDLEATCFACVEALVEKEKSSKLTSEDFAHDSVTK